MSPAASPTEPGTGGLETAGRATGERAEAGAKHAGANDLAATMAAARAAADALLGDAVAAVRGRLGAGQAPGDQRAVHALAWLATYAQAIRQLACYTERMHAEGRLEETSELLVRIGAGECLDQMAGGIPMSQGEMARLRDVGLDGDALDNRLPPAAQALRAGGGNTAANRARLMALIGDAGPPLGDPGLDDTLETMRAQMRRFADAAVVPNAQRWHLANSYIPLTLIATMAELGVFALTVPQDYGGLGLGKVAMCVVSEELSRGYIGVGSIATRTEIAAELILTGGTPAQKDRWLPALASGAVLPTAVFTEPDVGSDLAAIRTRAVRGGDGYTVTGNKTWITHPVRADLMTLLVRTGEPGYRGLSMLLAPKPRGTDADPFPAAGMSGTEIEVLGYRGMKEYEIAFDGFAVPSDALLGGVEGRGFKQLMATFESARIQTAARAVGVAQAAMEQAIAYARSRIQFGRRLIAFARVADKIAMMAAEIMIARQITYAAAREKDQGRRCDLQAGMAKLFSARAAFAAADGAVQIHGGNGFALEYPASRLLCDARILSIFEGSAEIQAAVIARRLLGGAD